ncbi:FAD-binding oxidoreductase [Nissabacter sp. SGAir0207]|uniref:NAD(P)/FAD-dependent oxidoreductase n=1 Tax=Nissabacter sp. SGAir0207 TaxID=2126321 RepID=UPI0010CD2509|nr:FAD-binding oxidoreductase [Nissabacter sp. SGAir0207]QCR38274.1 aminophosphonate oxidoreductase [Nissabacter sp. SGAir0207]
MYRGFWYAQALDLEGALAPTLQGTTSADVCIIGGGFLGLWSAIRLKKEQPSLDVVLIEKDRCGSGASGRNGGLANNWWAKYLSLMSICGEQEARRICEAADSAVDEIGEFCRAHNVDAQYRKDGWLWTASNPRQHNSWRVLTEKLDNYNANPFREVTPEEARAKSGSPRTLSGIFDPNAATVQPAMLARGLRRVAIELGVRIYEKTPLTRLDRRTAPVVHTAHGSVRAKKVVIAMNAWGAQFPELKRMIVVMSSDMVATAPMKTRLDATGFNDGVCVTDSRTVLNYWRNTPDGRIVFGKPLGQFAFASRIGNLYDRPCPAAEGVTAELRSFYPTLADVPVVSSWTGPLDRAMKGLPNFGFLGGNPNIIYGIGFSGNGVATTVFASRIIKSLVLEANDEWSRCGLVDQKVKLLPPEPFRFVGARMVRNALVRKETLEDHDRDAGAFTTFLTALAPAGYVPNTKK